MTLDQTDRDIINKLQEGFPLTPRPYADFAETIGLSEAELLERIGAMKEAGVITRFGPFLDAAAMGGAFCLCAIAVLLSWRHRGNIQRLLAGNESRLGQRASSQPAGCSNTP